MKKANTLFALIFLSTTLFAQWEILDFGGNTTDRVHQVRFYNDSIGYITGENGLFFKTTDAGKTWEAEPDSFEDAIFDIQFVNDSVGFLSSGYYMFKTVDRGMSWKQIRDFSLDEVNYYKLFFMSVDSAFCFYRTKEGEMLFAKSTNPEKAWSKVVGIPSRNKRLDVHFFDARNYFILTGRDISFYTNFKGYNTFMILFENTIDSVSTAFDYADSSTFCLLEKGIVMSNRNIDFNDRKSYKWGWNSYYIDSTKIFNDIKFINRDTGFIVCNDGIILRSMDGGVHWDSFEVKVDADLYGITVHGNTVYVFGDNGTVLKTENLGGEAYRLASTPEKGKLQQEIIVFPNPVRNKLNIQNIESGSFEIYDLVGNLVSDGQLKNQIDVSQLQSGIYILRVMDGNGLYSSKFIKE
jgi:photosystem II stability/assembly factor-like uncharacterized protein